MTIEEAAATIAAETAIVRPTPDERPLPSRHRRQLRWAAALTPCLLLGAVRAGWFSEGDTFWQIETGREILRRGTIFLTDDFTWTIAGQAWHPNSWGFDVALALAYNAAGPLGLAGLTLALITAVGLVWCALARALGCRPLPTLVATSWLLLPMLAWLSTRPQTATYALLPLVLGIAGRTLLQRGRAMVGRVAAVYLVTAVWVNLHLAALGVLPALAGGLAAVGVAHGPSSWRRLFVSAGAILLAATLGCASSPFGWGAVTSALATRDASSTLIVEWAPLWRTSAVAEATWIAAAIGVGLAGLAWRRRPADPRLAMYALGSAVLLLLGLEAARFSPMALAAAAPAIVKWVSDHEWHATGFGRRIAFLTSRTAIAWVAALLVIAVIRLPNLGQPSPSDSPTASTIAAIPAGCRVLNEYDDGGYLILRRGPDGVRVAVDGRNDAYGDQLVAHLQSLLAAPPGALQELRSNAVTCMLLRPDRPLISRALAAGWRITARDSHRVLLIDA